MTAATSQSALASQAALLLSELTPEAALKYDVGGSNLTCFFY